jgi:hypothetical protein
VLPIRGDSPSASRRASKTPGLVVLISMATRAACRAPFVCRTVTVGEEDGEGATAGTEGSVTTRAGSGALAAGAGVGVGDGAVASGVGRTDGGREYEGRELGRGGVEARVLDSDGRETRALGGGGCEAR